MSRENYLRFPLWILEIDWFGADPERIVNPKPIPLSACTTVDTSEEGLAKAREQRRKFCAFVVSNPSNPVRNAAFHWLSAYKPVDSAGRLFNNVGDAIFAGAGGGGGELKKMEFFSNYKFALTYENSAGRGYTTEKYLHAKAAGCVPIYWGDPAFERDFDAGGCIDAREVRTPEELVSLVRRVDEDDAEWVRRYSVPALDSYKVAWCQRTMAELCSRLFSFGGRNVSTAPRFIGDRPLASARAEAAAAAAAPPVPVAITAAGPLELPVLATYANRLFLSSLQQWLGAAAAQRQTVPQLRAIVYVDPDIPQETLAAVKEKFGWPEFRTLPSAAGPPAGAFEDFWAPQHYGWKLWILREICNEAALAGRMILYTDAGTFLCRWPQDWLLAAQESGICFLEDPREENGRWCSDAFCAALGVTEAEKGEKQVQAATIAFRAGPAGPAHDLFEAALEAGKHREVLAGDKWAPSGPDGLSRGHRHDQSILSILSGRARLRRFPLDKVQCRESLRETFASGRSIYIHRGNFQMHKRFAPAIDEAYVINLDRRADRMERLWQNNPELKGRVKRWSAVDGKALRLTPALERFLRPNDFFWKKAVAGCALSHLGLWWKLATDHPDIQNYLVLEDDVKFTPNWEGAWQRALTEGHVPDDYDILYLGGVLPPNREGWFYTRDRVNDSFVRVAENQAWGQAAPTRYFHFCAYAYILSKRGAEKIMALLKAHDGYWTSADHILCNPVDVLKSYVLDPRVDGNDIGLLAGCYQDDDPKYATAEFNDFSRIDAFDSDLWNNDERFSEEERALALKAAAAAAAAGAAELDIVAALADARAAPAPAAPVAAPVLAAQPSASRQPVKILPRRLVCLPQQKLDLSKLHEYEWLMYLFGNPTMAPVEFVDPGKPAPPNDEPIVIVQRPFTSDIIPMLERWSELGATFYVLHLSDELTQVEARDPIQFYDLSGCKGVLRFYQRDDLGDRKNVKVIPLGYHWTLQGGSQDCMIKTPRLPFRETAWTFLGTNWIERQEMLAPLGAVEPHRAKFFGAWNDPAAFGREEYIAAMLDSVFVPCPDGVNAETFRFYEALECGCVPLVVRTAQNGLWLEWVSKHIPILQLGSWVEAAAFMQVLLADKPKLEAYRENLLRAWMVWREQLKKEISAWLKG
jgi:GR25 family glycosyltransferase involved in LPS biosynthesis